ncbi:hypothetical protein GE115_08325 [Agromyces sp. CFH 90414]|uniref:Uncharacterized protein n=1 Tax=Agromyces agglutinans TaxID=2662258 RepID=A0A6I2FD46_9MICO|nr:hypothetical protein [Agromyces agglutinans]MRG59873.1 hypothetical protein [Agromyces agglutinans]
MTFSIQPAALSAQASSLRALADSTPLADTYATDHLTLEWVDTVVLFARARDAAHSTRDAVTAYLASIADAHGRSADELVAIADDSVATDDAIEAELDAAYPESGASSSPPIAPSNQAVYTAPAPPEDSLVAPADGMPEDLVSTILTTDWLSPSTVVAQIIDWIFDWNYLDEISNKFSGDWDRLYSVSSAIGHLSAYHEAQGAGVTHAMAVCASNWRGNAADAANVFFHETSELLREAAAQLTALAPEFETVARGMKDTADLVAGLFATIMDLAIATAWFYIAGTVLIETVVGTVIGYLAGTGTLAYLLWLVSQAYEAVQSVLLFFDALGAAVGVLSQFLAGGAELPLPTPYDNPMVEA